MLATLLIVFAGLLVWYGVTSYRETAKRRALLRATLTYQTTPAVRGVLLETRGPNVLPLMPPVLRTCPACGFHHMTHPAVIDPRCPACTMTQFDDAPINPDGSWPSSRGAA